MNLIKTISLLSSSILLLACQDKTEQTPVPQSDVTPVAISQPALNTLAKTLDVKYSFVSNIETDCPKLDGKQLEDCYTAEVLLTNNSDTQAYITDQSWQLNFSQVYPAYASESDDFNLVHINGDLHQITPKRSFKGFKAGETRKVKLWVNEVVLTESELMPNYWLSADNLAPALVLSTKTKIDQDTGLELQPYVVPFNTVKHIKSTANDINKYASPAWLYQNESAIDTHTTDKSHLPFTIIPTPKSLKILDQDKRLNLSSGISLSLEGNLTLADISASISRLELLGLDVQVQSGSDKSSSRVLASIELNNNKAEDWQAGHYQLAITAAGIKISAQDNTGAFYGLQSLASLLTVGSSTVPLVEIDDQPRYPYRGQHVDVGRNFHDKAFMITLIKQMAAYKLNKLHLHLAEDEGWRLEIPSLPELTLIGSKRCMSASDENCLQPQLGGAMASDRDGYYSVADYQEILKVASEHHIQVIPSLDMPGHSRAAVKAMEARYRYYMEQEDEVEATRYLLSDFDDKTKYSSIQNYNDNTLNVCMESTYVFVDRVLEDLKAMHQQAGQPLTLYHIGADETAGAWLDSPQCQALVDDKSNEVNDMKHLGAHFIERVSQMVANKGIAVGGWNDGLGETQAKNMPEQVYSYIWDALPWGAHEKVSEQASRNWNIILSLPDVFYFDFPYQVDPKERGYNWASRRLTTRTIFNFMPDNLPVHAEFRLDTLGQNFVSDDRLRKDEAGNIIHQPLSKGFDIKGVQGQLWSETIRSEDQAEYMIYPRLLALAERAWHQASWQVPYDHTGKRFDKNTGAFTDELRAERDKKWLAFSQTIGNKELAKLDLADIFYRLPTVGAKVINGELHANVAIKGLAIEYQEKDGNWQVYQQPIKVNLPVNVRARHKDINRAGRSLTITKSD
jgi:hexosaminidase